MGEKQHLLPSDFGHQRTHSQHHLPLLYITFLFPSYWYSQITSSLTWAPFKCCTTTALAIMDVTYGLNRLKDPLQPHWAMSLFLLISLWKPFVSCSTTTRMPRWSSFFLENTPSLVTMPKPVKPQNHVKTSWLTCQSLQAPAQGGSLLRRKKLLQPCRQVDWKKELRMWSLLGKLLKELIKRGRGWCGYELLFTGQGP